MTKINNDASYAVAGLANYNRYWFKREFCDIRHGRTRTVLATIEKAGGQDFDQVSGLPWNVSIEDRNSKQSWKLIQMRIDNQDKLVFERYTTTREGVKGEILNLAYLPIWITEEIGQLAIEMQERHMDSSGISFLNYLVIKINQEKTEAIKNISAKVEKLSIGGLHHIMTTTMGDSRGSFREVARFPEIELLTGYDFVGKQVNHSISTYGTLRGLHVEPWAKLVTVISGFCVSILLDCRKNSKTFGKTETVFLGYGTTPDGKKIEGGALFIEPGIANSTLVLSEKLDYSYVVDDLWRPDTAVYAVNPLDPALGIDWGKYVPLDKIKRSGRDTNSPTFAEYTNKIG